MQKDTFNWFSFVLRLVFALALVYATYNPEGYSYFHWVKSSFGHQESGLLGYDAVKFVAGILLLAGWVIFINATREALGIFGVVIVLALCGGMIWLFAEMNLFQPGNTRLIVHLAEITIAVVLAVGLSWAHIHRQLTGQVEIENDRR